MEIKNNPWKKLSNGRQAKFLNKWIRDIARTETDLSIKKHIILHAKEIFKNNPDKWSASMKNLVDIFDVMRKIKPTLLTRLERLHKKYKENPKRYTPPPKT